MSWTPEITKSRFIEAAETERYLPRPRIGTGSGFWPLHKYTSEDRDGWDDLAKADAADQWARNRKLTREAISRHEECLIWSMTILSQDAHRHIVWKWAFCQVNGWSFSEACKRKNWVRVTAYRRLTASFERISAHLINSGALLRLPENRHMVTENDFSDSNCGRVVRSVAATSSAIPFTPSFRTEPSTDLLTTPDAVADFSTFLNRRNAKLRKIQEWRNEGAA